MIAKVFRSESDVVSTRQQFVAEKGRGARGTECSSHTICGANRARLYVCLVGDDPIHGDILSRRHTHTTVTHKTQQVVCQ